MANKIIGREREQKELEELYRSDRPIFAVIYGRRRVGKTYLVRQMFEKKQATKTIGRQTSNPNNSRHGEDSLLRHCVSITSAK